MIKANQSIFLSFSKIINGAGVPKIKIDGTINKCIKTNNHEEKEFLKLAKIENSFDCGSAGQFLLISYQESYYLICRSRLVPFKLDSSSIFDEIELNGGIVTLILSHFVESNYIHCTPLEAFNIISVDDDTINNTIFFDFTDILKISGPINAYKINRDLIFSGNFIYKAISLLLLEGGKLNLRFADCTTDLFTRFLHEMDVACPHDKILDSLLSNSWSHAFLEIYRLVELLYPVNRITKLKNELSIACNIPDLYKYCFNLLGWKPNEEHALFDLISETDGIIEHYSSQLSPFIPDLSNQSLAKFIYTKRNECVHFRMATSNSIIDEKLGNSLISVLIYISIRWQKIYIDHAAYSC